MKATFKVTFLLQKGKLKASGKAPFVTRIIVNGEMAHFSTQQEIEPDRWDAKGNRTLGLRAEERTINMILDEIKASLHRYYYDCQASGESVSALKLKNDETELARVKQLLDEGGVSQSDYEALELAFNVSKTSYANLLENTIIVLLLLGIAVFFGFFMSRRYVKPVLQSIADYKEGKKSDSSVQEIDDLFSFLEQKDLAHSRELSRLAFDRKNEIDPYQYQMFLTGFESLTPTEREIFDLYVDGKDTKEITRIKGIRESTLRYHNRNIYSKLGIRSLKQMLRYAAVMKEEDK